MSEHCDRVRRALAGGDHENGIAEPLRSEVLAHIDACEDCRLLAGVIDPSILDAEPDAPSADPQNVWDRIRQERAFQGESDPDLDRTSSSPVIKFRLGDHWKPALAVAAMLTIAATAVLVLLPDSGPNSAIVSAKIAPLTMRSGAETDRYSVEVELRRNARVSMMLRDASGSWRWHSGANGTRMAQLVDRSEATSLTPISRFTPDGHAYTHALLLVTNTEISRLGFDDDDIASFTSMDPEPAKRRLEAELNVEVRILGFPD